MKEVDGGERRERRGWRGGIKDEFRGQLKEGTKKVVARGAAKKNNDGRRQKKNRYSFRPSHHVI